MTMLFLEAKRDGANSGIPGSWRRTARGDWTHRAQKIRSHWESNPDHKNERSVVGFQSESYVLTIIL